MASSSREAGAPTVEGDGVVQFQPYERVLVFPGQAVFAQVAVGHRPVLEGLGVVRLQLDTRLKSSAARRSSPSLLCSIPLARSE